MRSRSQAPAWGNWIERRGTRASSVGAVVLALVVATLGVAPAGAETLASGDAHGEISSTEVVLGNALVERRWDVSTLATTRLADKRAGGLVLTTRAADFSLVLDGARIQSDALPVASVSLTAVTGGGVRATWRLVAPGVASIRRDVEVYPAIAGWRARTTIEPLATVALSGYTLDEVAAGPAVAPTIHEFRAGADWRFDSGWNPVSVGDAHKGDWRVARSAGAGQALRASGEWLSLAAAGGARAFVVAERRNYASSVMAYDGAVARAEVDLSRDVVYIGPFEENAHAENPSAGPARHRLLGAGAAVTLEPSFTGLATTPDDEPWQHFQMLARGATFPKAVIFNTDKVDANQRSTGAKDDVDYARFLTLLAAAREMGVETFVFDDGWQARNGDWCADSASCPDPRWDGSATSKFRPRFPDDHFAQVGTDLAGAPGAADDVGLGLWFTPMNFHPLSAAYRASPQWACAPVGHATAAPSLVDQSSSFEPGIGVWNPEALGTHPDSGTPARLIDYIEGRIERAITTFGARYFKFDFLVWIDCGGASPVDLYGYHDSFLTMLDRLRTAHPEVTFTIDETNDYRMFPFESVARGATWFQNGTPGPTQLLHNLWNLAPYVPGYALGQHALGDASTSMSLEAIDARMAAALGSHITFWTQIDARLTTAQRARVKRWTDFYKAERATLATFTYPLLADPSAGGWTALQPWDPEAGRGWLLAYRQGAGTASASIPLRGVTDGTYALTLEDPATGTAVSLGSLDAATLRTSGVPVTVSGQGGYALIRVVRTS